MRGTYREQTAASSSNRTFMELKYKCMLASQYVPYEF